MKNKNNNLSNYTEKDTKLFEDFFSNLKLSRQYQQEFSEWIPEIAYRQECSVEDILSNSTLLDIKESAKLNEPQKLIHIRGQLYKMRFPELAETKKKWESLVASLNPNKKSIHFKTDPYFEKSGIEITIKADDTEKLIEQFKRLLEIDKKSWDLILDPFREV